MSVSSFESVDRPRHLAQDDPRRFNMLTGQLRAIKQTVDGQERMYLTGTASSTVRDRHGSVLNPNCQAKMLSQASGMTMWLNHDYSVPESILGVCLEPSLNQRKTEDDEDCLDLDIRVEIYDGNPKAVQSWQAVDRGVQLGFSIGAMFLDIEIDDDADFWDPRFTVLDVDLIEISLVGIPSNPRAKTKQRYVNDVTRKMRANVQAIGNKISERARGREDVRELVKRSLLAGRRPEDILLNETIVRDAPVTQSEEIQAEEPAAAATADGTVAVPAHAPADDDGELSVAGTQSPVPTGSVEAEVIEPLAVAEAQGEQVTPESNEVIPVVEETQRTAPAMHTRASDSDDDDPQDVPAEKVVRKGVKAMRAMKRSLSPGMHKESMSHLVKAHRAVASLMPADYDVPADALLDGTDLDDDANRAAEQAVATLLPTTQQAHDDLRALVAEANTKRAALDADIAQREAKLAALATEVSEKEAKLAKLNATPSGRRSEDTNPGGSTQTGSEPLASPDLYAQNPATLQATMSRKLASTGVDARARA